MAVLNLADEGRIKCSEKTKRPSAASISSTLDPGDFYPAAVGEPIATFAWPRPLQAGGRLTLPGSAQPHRAQLSWAANRVAQDKLDTDTPGQPAPATMGFRRPVG